MHYAFEHNVAVRMAGEIVEAGTVGGRCTSKKYGEWLCVGVIHIDKLSDHALVGMSYLRQAVHHNPAGDGLGIRCVKRQENNVL